MPVDTLTPILDKVKMILRMFSSDQAGDILAAQRALMRLLKSSGCDIHVLADSIGNGKLFSEAETAKIYQRGFEAGRRDAERREAERREAERREAERREAELAQAASASHENSWEAMVDTCVDQFDQFTPKEQSFLRSMQDWYGEPTERQLDWLVALFERLQK